MARKSRKETVVLPAPEIDTTCRAGIYVRLSVEDKHTHTASIETQQLIIARYLEQNPEIIVVQTYIDNGATGTNFHRPGFQQMLSDIEAGLINCVIVTVCLISMVFRSKSMASHFSPTTSLRRNP